MAGTWRRTSSGVSSRSSRPTSATAAATSPPAGPFAGLLCPRVPQQAALSRERGRAAHPRTAVKDDAHAGRGGAGDAADSVCGQPAARPVRQQPGTRRVVADGAHQQRRRACPARRGRWLNVACDARAWPGARGRARTARPAHARRCAPRRRAPAARAPAPTRRAGRRRARRRAPAHGPPAAEPCRLLSAALCTGKSEAGMRACTSSTKPPIRTGAPARRAAMADARPAPRWAYRAGLSPPPCESV